MSSTASSVIVFGATGDVGGQLVRTLATQHPTVTVTAAVRSLEKAKGTLPRNVRPAQIDKADIQSVKQAVADSKADSAFLYAQTASAAVLMALKSAGVRRIVFLSSSCVGLVGLPADDLIAQLHTQAENAIRALGVTYVFLRAEWFQSNVLRLKDQIDEGKVTLAYPDAPSYVVAAADIAAAAATALTTIRYDNKAIEVVGPAPLSDRQLLAIISKVIGRPIEVEQIGRAERALQLNEHHHMPALSESLLNCQQFRDEQGADVWVADQRVQGSTSFGDWVKQNVENLIVGVH